MRFRRPPRANKTGAARPVSAQLDPAVVSERAASAARALAAGGVPPDVIGRAARELGAIASTPAPWPEIRQRVLVWAVRPEHQRMPRLARLLAAIGNASRRREDLEAQLTFLKRIHVLSMFGMVLASATLLEKERTARRARARSIRNKQQ